jgi:hypothetical protein
MSPVTRKYGGQEKVGKGRKTGRILAQVSNQTPIENLQKERKFPKLITTLGSCRVDFLDCSFLPFGFALKARKTWESERSAIAGGFASAEKASSATPRNAMRFSPSKP